MSNEAGGTRAEQLNDETFLPAVSASTFNLPARLKKPYAVVRNSIASTHAATKEMWGQVFEFAVISAGDENAKIVENICKKHGITSYAKTSSLAIGLRIAISTPTVVRDKNGKESIELQAPNAVVSNYASGFEYAFEVGRCRTKQDYIDFLKTETGGDGRLQVLNEKGREWKATGKQVGKKSNHNRSGFSTALERIVSKKGHEIASGLIRHDVSEDSDDGTYKIIVHKNSDGIEILGATTLTNSDIKSELSALARSLSKEDLPRSLDKCLRSALKVVKKPSGLRLDVNNGNLLVHATDDNGETREDSFLVDLLENEKTLELNAAQLNALPDCLSVLGGAKADWTFGSHKRKHSIIATSTAGDITELEDAYNQGKSRKIAINRTAVIVDGRRCIIQSQGKR